MNNKREDIQLVEVLDESKPLSEQANDLRKLIRHYPIRYEAKIISYLESGRFLLMRTTPVFDCLSSKNEFISGVSFFSDGTWIWKSYIVHYLKKYHISLPTSFINHIQSNNWQIPKISDYHKKILTNYLIDYLKLRN